ncbi:TM2 domain-containing protein [Paenibacillus campi]|uniref:TM2 domain-containing protein n=1 Tax=Paenibacillus campi TaxID=3106031 RepID=UPI002AFFC08D|nr:MULTISPECIES: TM2 domain-containing protein [unclassified Paenibacillus]
MLLNSEMRPREKSLGLAYLMLIGGHLGVHRFYLKRKATAIVQLVLFLIAALGYVVMVLGSGFSEHEPTSAAIVGLVIFAIAGLPLFIWIVVDLFLIPSMVRSINAQLEHEIMQQLEWLRSNPQTARGTGAVQPPNTSQPPSAPQSPYLQK